MTPERRIVLDLARTSLNDRQAIAHLVARAGELAKRVQASKARRRVKSAPRRKAVKATKAQRQENWREAKNEVLSRANGQCEVCANDASDVHHLMAGPLKRKYEEPKNLVALCRVDHDAWHRSDPYTMRLVYNAAYDNDASFVVLAALERRIQKATQRTA